MTSKNSRCSCGNLKYPESNRCKPCWLLHCEIRRSLPAKKKGECSVSDCARESFCRGLCGTHYKHDRLGKPLRAIRERRPSGTLCDIAGCNGKHSSHGYCAKHYELFKRNGVPEKIQGWHDGTTTTGICSIEGCGKEKSCMNLCSMHYGRMHKNGTVGPSHPVLLIGMFDHCCICLQPVHARGLCNIHYRRFMRNGDPLDAGPELKPIGTRVMRVDSYRPNKIPYIKTESGWKAEKRLKVEERLGRSLSSEECVFYIDGDSSNITPANLWRLKKGHRRMRPCFRCGSTVPIKFHQSRVTKRSLCSKCLDKFRQGPGQKLLPNDVKIIRYLHIQHDCSYSLLGKLFKVSSGNIHCVCSGKNWKSVSLRPKKEEVQEWLTKENLKRLENIGVKVESMLIAG